ncbi:hypothetical protein IMSAGC019_03181 [Lachnospiraceae bacterium]|nr:hypothetical protein IMSAGC019_03181 [Lachnospiraceae bacterium]
MSLISFFIFFISFTIFGGIMLHDPRTLWSGVTFFWMMACLALFAFFTLSQYSQWLMSHNVVIGILVFLVVLAMGCVVAFPAVLVLIFFVEGIRVIRHEGMKPANLLSLLFSVLLSIYLVLWPRIGNLQRDTLSRRVYGIISFSAVYFLSLLAMYSLSAILNLIHLRKRRKADYIVVLGSGIIGERVTPLLAARIERGIELLGYNPGAVLIMSGGQGPGEDIPESQAMAAYAIGKGVGREKIITEEKSVSTQENLLFSKELMEKPKPRIIIVTTAYHVFRALILAKKQGIKCTGYGSKTKWYFTLNALIREFAGYLHLTWKRHALFIGFVAGMATAAQIIAWLY